MRERICNEVARTLGSDKMREKNTGKVTDSIGYTLVDEIAVDLTDQSKEL